METPKLQLEVAYASPKEERVISLEVLPGTTLEEAIYQSGMLHFFPEIDLSVQAIGVFSKLKNLSDLVENNDRIEIYRPLMLDPKEARRRKAMNRR